MRERNTGLVAASLMYFLFLILCCQSCLKAVRQDAPCEASQIASVADEGSPVALGGYLIGSGGVAKDTELRLATVFKVYATGDGSFYLDAFVPLKGFLLEEFEQVTAHIMTVPGEEIVVPLQHQRLGLLVKMKQEMEKAKLSFPDSGTQQDLLILETQLGSLLQYEREIVESEILESSLAKLRLRRLRFAVDLTTLKAQLGARSFDPLERFTYFQRLTNEYDEMANDFGQIGKLYEITEHLLRLKQWIIATKLNEVLGKLDSYQAQTPSVDLRQQGREMLERYGDLMQENCSIGSFDLSFSTRSSSDRMTKCFQIPDGNAEPEALLYMSDENVDRQVSALAKLLDSLLANNFSGNYGTRYEMQMVLIRMKLRPDSQQELETWFGSIDLKEYKSREDSNISHLLLEAWPENTWKSVEQVAGPRVVLKTTPPKDPFRSIDNSDCAGVGMVTVDHWPIYSLETGCIAFYEKPVELIVEIPDGETGAPPIAEVEEVGLPSGAIKEPKEKEISPRQSNPGASDSAGGVKPPTSSPPAAERPEGPPARPGSEGFTPRAGKVPCVQ